ncbi:hypothetical protein [Streptomyces sp. NPDC101455]|uniref:hypothetical protein n=1 Tax=Streptomyces sp. NPDC101455 TaxID=3366142 RepID=UPI00381B78BB
MFDTSQGPKRNRPPSCTVAPLSQETDTAHYIATHHLEGDLPGGTVDLHYRFALRDDLVEHLVIEP